MGRSTLFEDTFIPFGHGTLTVGSTQYGTEAALVLGSTYAAIDTFTLPLPLNSQIAELECYLQAAVATSVGGTVYIKWQGSDDNSNWGDLSAAQQSTASSSTSYVDQPAVSGVWSTASSTNFAMQKNPLYVRLVAMPGSTAGASDAVKAKGTSYIIARYWIG